MREPEDREKSGALERLIAEARQDARARSAGERVDWDTFDQALFDRIDRDGSEPRAEIDFRGSSSPFGWGGLAALTAAAATVLFLAGGGTFSDAPLDALAPTTMTAGYGAGKLLRRDNGAVVLVNGRSASPDQALAKGDSVETQGGRAVFAERLAVTWALESSSRVAIGRSHGPLVLNLERGAIEAQIAPVARGEAFAVDIGGARVAVHGTHLRVERVGPRVVVDLTEGVISVGPAPLRGSTYGSLVAAPAHVEFQIADPRGSLRIDHGDGHVRAATSLPIEGQDENVPAAAPFGSPAASADSALEEKAKLPARSALSPRAPASSGVARAAEEPPPSKPPAPAAESAEPAEPPQEAPIEAHAAEPPKPVASPPPPQPSAQQPDPADTGVAGVVKACWESHRPKRGDAQTVTHTTLTVESGDDGAVRLASFEPALAPAVQACASDAIYKTRFAGAARIVIPIQLTR